MVGSLRFANKIDLEFIWFVAPRMVLVLIMVLPNYLDCVLWGLISPTILLLCVYSLDCIPSNELSVGQYFTLMKNFKT